MNPEASPLTQRRVYVQDIRPYFTPAGWQNFKGPATGTLRLPHHVWWAPGPGTFDLDDPTQTVMAYQALVIEGTQKDQESLLNSEVLTRVWGCLRLPHPVRARWETKFPALRGEREAHC